MARTGGGSHCPRLWSGWFKSSADQGHDWSCLSRCFGEDVCISIPDVDAYIMVLQANEPQITLQGTERFWRPAAQFESARGVTLFPDIKIVSSFAKTEASGDTRATGTGAYGAAGRVE